MPPKRQVQAGTSSKPKRTRNAYKEPSQLNNDEGDDCIHVRTVSSEKLMTSSFLSLPRELRDQIYHEVWRSMPPIDVTLPAKGDHKSLAEASGLHIDHYIFRIVYELTQAPVLQDKSPKKKRMKSAKAALPANTQSSRPWFLANRQILYEAMEQFNSHVTWTYVSKLEDKRLQPAAWKAPLTKRRSKRLGPLLLGLRNATNIHLPTRFNMYTHGKMDAKESPISIVEFEGASNAELLRAFVAGIAGTTKLKRLSLGVQANAWRGGANNHPIVVDLRLLESLELPNLQCLHVAVSFNAMFYADERLMKDLREGLRMVGRRIFGDDMREQFQERHAPEPERFVLLSHADTEWCFTWTRG